MPISRTNQGRRKVFRHQPRHPPLIPIAVRVIAKKSGDSHDSQPRRSSPQQRRHVRHRHRTGVHSLDDPGHHNRCGNGSLTRRCAPTRSDHHPSAGRSNRAARHRSRLQPRGSLMGNFIAFLYGFVFYLVFFVTFLYAVGFVEGLVVPKAIDSGVAAPLVEALIVNLLLMSLFAIQHSVMARRQFKAWWTQFVPKSVERSTYVLLASLALVLLFWQWRPMPAVVWQAANSQVAIAIMGLSFLGWLIVLLSTFMINHFELFGLHQVVNHLAGRDMPAMRFKTPMLYNFVRHPIYLGFIIAFWAAPTMTVG